MSNKCLLIPYFLLFCSFTACTTSVSSSDDTAKYESGANLSISDSSTFSASMSESSRDLTEFDKSIWYEKKNYPVKFGDEKLNSISTFSEFDVVRDYLNPPEDLVANLSNSELAHLVLTYPLFNDLPPVDTDILYCSVFESFNSAFHELLIRQSATDALLEEYEKLDFDVDAYMSGDYDISFYAESFIETYVMAYGESFSDEQRDLYQKIYEQRETDYYSKITDNNLSKFKIEFYDKVPSRKLP